jgi:hypothetical protein
MRSLLSLIMTMALAVAGCPSSTDTDTDTAGETDDPDQCPPGIDQQTFIDEHLQPLCEWMATCPDFSYQDVEACFRGKSRFYNGRPGWDECAAVDCAAWTSDAPTCTTQLEISSRCDEVKPPND